MLRMAASYQLAHLLSCLVDFWSKRRTREMLQNVCSSIVAVNIFPPVSLNNFIFSRHMKYNLKLTICVSNSRTCIFCNFGSILYNIRRRKKSMMLRWLWLPLYFSSLATILCTLPTCCWWCSCCSFSFIFVVLDSLNHFRILTFRPNTPMIFIF